jgi:hypothetical protein
MNLLRLDVCPERATISLHPSGRYLVSEVLVHYDSLLEDVVHPRKHRHI